MYVVEGRPDTIDADRRVVAALTGRVRREGRPAIRVWRPHPHVAFGPRDVRASGYATAAAAARARGYPPLERSVGGHPVAHTGGTLAFTRVEPIDDVRRGLQARYEAVVGAVAAALEDCGVETRRGEPPGAFCPGTHSLSAAGKVVGVAQRVRRDVAATSGVVVVTDRRTVADVLEPVYRALDLAFDPASVGSVANAGGHDEPDAVAGEIVDRLADGAATTALPAADLRGES